jgi:hypothetical protein
MLVTVVEIIRKSRIGKMKMGKLRMRMRMIEIRMRETIHGLVHGLVCPDQTRESAPRTRLREKGGQKGGKAE